MLFINPENPRIALPNSLIVLWLALAMVLLSGGALEALAQAPAQTKPIRLDNGWGEGCQDLRLAGTGQERLVVAWVVSAGEEAGIYLQTRMDLLWNPAIRLIGADADDFDKPRDLDITFDQQGRLHMVWTALTDGQRRVHIARLDDVSRPRATMKVQPIPVLADERFSMGGEADFPALTADADGGVVVVWQESQLLCFAIRAVRIAADGSIIDLGLVSGTSLSGLSPQVLDPDSLQVAWCEVQDVGVSLRVDQWRAGLMRWAPSKVERMLRQFEREDQALLYPTDLGLVSCWTGAQEVNAEDDSTTMTGGLEVGWLPDLNSGTASSVEEPLYETLGEAGRDVAYVGLSGRMGERLSVVWQEFSEERQAIRLASIFQSGEQAIQPLAISSTNERFASLPDHLTIGDWSVVVWTDDYRDGGSGGVYFSEIHWPSTPSHD